MGVANPEMGMASHTSTRQTDHGRSRQSEDGDLTPEGRGDAREREEEEEEGEREGESYYESLNAVEMLDLLSKIGDPNCTVTKLE